MKNKPFLPGFLRYSIYFSFVVFFIIVCAWIVAIPEAKIKSLAEGSITSGPLKIEINGLKKGLFYNFSADRLNVKNKDEQLFYVENISVRINPLYFFLLRLESLLSGDVRDGRISGSLSLSRNKRTANIIMRGLDIGDIQVLEKIGLKGTGKLDGDVTAENNRAGIRLNISNAEFKTVNLAGIDLPMEMFNKANGVFNMNSGEVVIESLSLEGDGIYGRIKGKIINNEADLTIELMPEASVEDKLLLLTLLNQYKISQGYYVIPVKTRINF